MRWPMRVLTLNVFAHHSDWPARRAVLRDGLAALAPDVALLQEVVVTDGEDQARDLFPTDHRVHHQPGRSADGVGAAIVSRWPMEVLLEVSLDGEPIEWIGSLVVVRVDGPEPIGSVLVAHHKPTWVPAAEADRERQALVAARHVERLAAEDELPVMLAGDLDATPDAASIRFLTGRQSLDGTSVKYHDAWAVRHPDDPGHTFSPANGIRSAHWRPRAGERIDYVMVRGAEHGGELDVVRCELAFDRPVDGVWGSDHFGVVADLEPKPATQEHP